MEIRPIHSCELSQLLELYRYLNPEDPVLVVDDETERHWSSIFADPHLNYFVAMEDSSLVGSCMLAIIPNLTRGAKPFGVIQNVVTHPEYRGRGIGTELLRFAKEYAWAQNCYQVLLQTGREETHGFYHAAGFRSDLKTGFVAKPS